MVVKTVDAAVSFLIGYYHVFGNASSIGNYLGVYEVVVVIAFELWALLVIVLALDVAGDFWDWTDSRLAEAAKDSIGLETAITWHLALKNVALIFVYVTGIVIAACGLSEVANELISYFDNYENDVNNESTDKNDASIKSTEGTAA